MEDSKHTGAQSVLESFGIAASEQRPAVLRGREVSERAWTAQVKGTENDFHRAIGAAEGILTYA